MPIGSWGYGLNKGNSFYWFSLPVGHFGGYFYPEKNITRTTRVGNTHGTKDSYTNVYGSFFWCRFEFIINLRLLFLRERESRS